MEANNLFEEACGWAAASLTFCFFISSLIPFIDLIKERITFEDIPGFYISITYINCLCWYIYGDFLYSDQVKFIYLLGTVYYLILVFIYLFYEKKKYKTDAILNGLIIILGTYMIYITLFFIIDNVDIIARICFVTYSILFIFPAQIIYKVFKNKNYALISFYRACGSFVASLCWVIYGYGITEHYIIYPHTIIILLATVQIILYLNYKKRYPIFVEKKIPATIDIETTETEEVKKEENTKNTDEETQPSINEKPVKIVEKIDN